MSESELDLSPAGLAAQARELRQAVGMAHGLDAAEMVLRKALTTVRDAARAERDALREAALAKADEAMNARIETQRRLDQRAEEVRQLREVLSGEVGRSECCAWCRLLPGAELCILHRLLAATEPSHG